MRSTQLVEMALAGLEAHHRNLSGRVHSTAEARVLPPRAVVHRKTRQQRWSGSLELFHFSEDVFQRLCNARGRFPMCDV